MFVRAIRTIRNAVQRHFEASKTLKWEAFVGQFIENYNKRVHSTTKVPPVDVVSEASALPEPPKAPAVRPWKIPQLGSFVRLNRLRGLHDKEASGNFTEEVFKVAGISRKYPIPMVYVEDLLGERVKGGLYPEEYQAIEWDQQRRVAKVIKQRHLKGRPREKLVTFVGYPDTYTLWVPASSV